MKYFVPHNYFKHIRNIFFQSILLKIEKNLLLFDKISSKINNGSNYEISTKILIFYRNIYLTKKKHLIFVMGDKRIKTKHKEQ